MNGRDRRDGGAGVSGLFERVGAYFFETTESSRRQPAPAPPPEAKAPGRPQPAPPPGAESAGRWQSPAPSPGAESRGRAQPTPPPEVESPGRAQPTPPPEAESPGRWQSPAPPPEAESVQAVVVGAAQLVVPVAAACAGELRARSKAAAALLCVWRPAEAPMQSAALEPDAADAPAARSPAGATTPGARRLAGRLVARGLTATACGRLAWLALDPDPREAAVEFHRCAASAGVPLVLAVAGPRPEPFEPLLADADLCVAVLPSDIEPALRQLAMARIPTRNSIAVPPLPPGPPRWAAMAGLARLRSLPGAAR